MSSKLRNHQRIARLSREKIEQLLNEHPLTAIEPLPLRVARKNDPDGPFRAIKPMRKSA
ncbi:MAG TPA: hypothetical protein VHD56_02910 [Tepidisphaeraceae bacterium]|nr:hypothetical protein [Tepidisphaeraceae bacterium]